jgi:outer membrane murein-binding lipoprotein Lpp
MLEYKAVNLKLSLGQTFRSCLKINHIIKTPPKMKKVLFLALALGSFTFSSCDSKKEDAQEQVGENVKEAGEAKADALEDKADAVRDSADAKGRCWYHHHDRG